MECLRENFVEGVILNNRYQTISTLNHGSFGMVFLAKDLDKNQLVAIKCLVKKSALGDDDESSFAVDDKSEELALHARLGNHPNIVNLIDSFNTDAHIYIVLEYCQRGDLYEAIRRGTGPLETEHVRKFMLQLVDAVSHIHQKGMYHRDIKPENIFLSQSGALKLGDFGLATTDTWSYETAVGSDRYMSPEQYDSAGDGYSPAQADIWAIGICLLNILFERNPFNTPTESDPLFLDFSRDKQSLFDVFPTMSQDTFEVIDQCMSLDPRKRSLTGVREALLRAVSFTIDDPEDDFNNVTMPIIASANREPLRTPSIQSPHVDTGAFPWAKALHASPPQNFRQLSVIEDTESYSEDLFATSVGTKQDWFSVHGQTPSMSSVLTSSLAASINMMSIGNPSKRMSPMRPNLTPISGSLPITMAKAKPIPSLAQIFGRKNDMVSKSWGDLWDEEQEEEEEHERELRDRKAQNARTWSHESVAVGNDHDDAGSRREGLSEPKSTSFINTISATTEAEATAPITIAATGNGIDDHDIVNDVFFFQDDMTPKRQPSPPHHLNGVYSPPSKRADFDKWAALGNRRRETPGGTGMTPTEKPEVWRGRRATMAATARPTGFSGFGHGVWDLKDSYKDKAHHGNHHGQHGNGHQGNQGKACPWSTPKQQQHPRKEKADLGDLEWVGGWQDSVV
jgi:serine/threonine protein kinase